MDGIDAKRPKVLDIGVDHPVECLRVVENLDLKGFACRVAPHAVIADRPAGLVEHGRGAPQVLAVELAVRRGGRHHDRPVQHAFGELVRQWPQEGKLALRRRALGLQIAVFPEGIDPLVDAVEQRLVGPFEIEHHADGLAHALVLKLVAPQVEDKGLAAGKGAVGRCVFLCPAVLDGRKIIAGRPDFRRSLGPVCVSAGLEALERAVVVGEILDPDTVEIMPPLVDWEVVAPIVGVAPVYDLLANLQRVENIGPGPDPGCQSRCLKIGAACLVIGFGKNRQPADCLRQVARRLAFLESEFHPVRAQRLGALDLLLDDRAKRGKALVAQNFIGKDDVIRRQWRAVGKARFRAHVEDDVRPVLGIFQRLCHKAVDSIRLVGRALEKAFEKDRGQLPRPSLGCVGMHGVKGSKSPDRNFPAFRRVRIDIVQMREPGLVFELTERRNAV